MTVFTGFFVPDILVRASKDAIFSDNLSVTATYSDLPISGTLMAPAAPGPLKPVWTWIRHDRPSGVRVPSFLDDFYYRIHVTPNPLDVGYVPSISTFEVEVWNAYFESKNLSTITPDEDEGITYSGVTLPQEFKALQAIILDFTVSNQGPSEIKATYLFTFSDAEDPLLLILGFRSVFFPGVPDWGRGMLERLSFLTDVMTSRDGTEQRVDLRENPRQTLEFDFSLFKDNLRNTVTAMFQQQGGVWTIPLWFQAQRLSANLDASLTVIPADTTHRGFYVGGSVFLYSGPEIYDSYQITGLTEIEISINRTLGRKWVAGSQIMPIRIGQIDGVSEFSRVTGEVAAASASFIILDNPVEDPIVLPEYRGYYLWDVEPNRISPILEGWDRAVIDYDYETGPRQRKDLYGYSKNTRRMEYSSLNRERIADYRGFIHYLRGKKRSVWIPTFDRDMVIVEDALAGENTIRIKSIGYTRHINTHSMRRDILVRLRTGQTLYRRIVSSDSLNSPAGTETIVLDQEHGIDILSANVYMVSYLQLSRGESDNTDFRWVTPGVVESSLITRLVPA